MRKLSFEGERDIWRVREHGGREVSEGFGERESERDREGERAWRKKSE